MRFVDRHVLDADAVLVAADVDYPIHHEKRIAVRQQFQHDRDIRRFEFVTILFMTTVSFVGRRVGVALLAREPLKYHYFAEPLLHRFCRCAAPTRTWRHIAMDNAGGRNLRAFADRDVVIQANARAQHNKILKS